MKTEIIEKNQENLNLPGCQLTPKGAVFDPSLSFEQWEAVGKTLRYLEKSILFWLGDWLNFGEKNFGDKYAQAIESTGYSLQTLQNAQWVAGRIPDSRRRESLTFSHHAEVAGLKSEDQKEILEKAEKEKLSTRELRTATKSRRRESIILDKMGTPIPSEIVEDWHRSIETASCLVSMIQDVCNQLRKGVEDRDKIFREFSGNVVTQAEALRYTVKSHLGAYAVCPFCHGRKSDQCEPCSQRGFVSKYFWESPAVPKKLKEIISKKK